MEPTKMLALLQHGAFDYVHEGRTRSGIARLRPDGPRVIVTHTPFGGPPAPHGVLDLIKLSGPSITPMVGVVQLQDGVVIAEVEPPGMCIEQVLPLPVADAVAVACALAETLADVHARGQTVWSAYIDPELVYVAQDEVGWRLRGLAPRGPVARSRAAENPRGMYNPPPPPPVHLISPEMAIGKSGAGAASDVYALCACLHWWATGESLYGEHDQPFAALRAIMSGDRTMVSAALPARIGAIVAAGTAKDAAARPTAGELAARLRAVGAG